MNTNSKPAIINALLWLASVASMIGIMFLSGRLFKEDNFVLLIEFIVITIRYTYFSLSRFREKDFYLSQ